MKKSKIIILIIISLLSFLSMIFCIWVNFHYYQTGLFYDYSEYDEINLIYNSISLGTIKIPNDWELEEKSDTFYIRDKKTHELIIDLFYIDCINEQHLYYYSLYRDIEINDYEMNKVKEKFYDNCSIIYSYNNNYYIYHSDCNNEKNNTSINIRYDIVLKFNGCYNYETICKIAASYKGVY